jgi:hypothetical protein
MLRRIAPLFFWLFLLPIFCAPVHGADATSFDPTLVTVKAIGTSSIPVGTIISWPVAQNPSDWQNSDGTLTGWNVMDKVSQRQFTRNCLRLWAIRFRI